MRLKPLFLIIGFVLAGLAAGVVKGAFAMRRKTLINCLKAAELAPVDDLRVILDECGIDGRRRGETLSMDEFAALSRRISG